MGPAAYVPAPAPVLTATAARLMVRNRRDRAIETGVVTVDGAPHHTDNTTQNRLLGAVVAAQIDPASIVNWKCADNVFRPLDAAQVVAVAQAVRAFVQDCYDREAALLLEIDAASDLTAVNIESGWPA